MTNAKAMIRFTFPSLCASGHAPAGHRLADRYLMAAPSTLAPTPISVRMLRQTRRYGEDLVCRLAVDFARMGEPQQRRANARQCNRLPLLDGACRESDVLQVVVEDRRDDRV